MTGGQIPGFRDFMEEVARFLRDNGVYHMESGPTLYTTRYVMEAGAPEGMYFVEFWEMIGDGIAISRGLWALRPIPDGWHVDWMGGIMPDESSGWEFPGFHDEEDDDDDWWR